MSPKCTKKHESCLRANTKNKKTDRQTDRQTDRKTQIGSCLRANNFFIPTPSLCLSLSLSISHTNKKDRQTERQTQIGSCLRANTFFTNFFSPSLPHKHTHTHTHKTKRIVHSLSLCLSLCVLLLSWIYSVLLTAKSRNKVWK